MLCFASSFPLLPSEAITKFERSRAWIAKDAFYLFCRHNRPLNGISQAPSLSPAPCVCMCVCETVSLIHSSIFLLFPCFSLVSKLVSFGLPHLSIFISLYGRVEHRERANFPVLTAIAASVIIVAQHSPSDSKLSLLSRVPFPPFPFLSSVDSNCRATSTFPSSTCQALSSSIFFSFVALFSAFTGQSCTAVAAMRATQLALWRHVVNLEEEGEFVRKDHVERKWRE